MVVGNDGGVPGPIADRHSLPSPHPRRGREPMSSAGKAFTLFALLPAAMSIAGSVASAQSGVPAPEVPWLTPGVAAHYASLLAALTVLALITVSVGERIWTAYAALMFAYITWQFFNELKLRGIVWQDHLSDLRLVVLGATAVSVYSLLLAAFAVNPGHRLSRLRPYLLAGAAACPLFWAIGAVSDIQVAVIMANIMLLAALSIHIVPFRTMRSLGSKNQRLQTAVGVALFVSILCAYVAVLVLYPPIELPAWALIITNRVTTFALVGFGGMVSIQRIFALRDDRARALREALAVAEKEAETNRSLLEAERNYARVRDLVRAQQERFAEVSHDIKQPIASLRAGLAIFAADQPPEARDQLRRAFDYLEQLADSYGSEPEQGRTANMEAVPVLLLTATLDRMFRREAEAKGLRFDVDSASGQVMADPLTLMRILSNLVSNAIAHTDSGRVRLTAFPDAGSIIFEVFSSSRPISDTDASRIFEPHEKGPESDGSGLGLAIVRRLAESAGLPLRLSSIPGSGNAFSLSVPKVG
jgi:signal transduction histidine kinase